MKNIIIKTLLMGVISTQLIGCAGFASGSQFTSKDSTVSSGQSKVVVYRNYRFGDKCMDVDVKIDGRSAGTLKCSGFVSAVVAPGTHTVDASGVLNPTLFTSGTPTHFTKSVRTSSGKANFLQLTGSVFNGPSAAGTVLLAVTGVGFTVTQYNLVPVSEQTALSQLSGLKKTA